MAYNKATVLQQIDDVLNEHEEYCKKYKKWGPGGEYLEAPSDVEAELVTRLIRTVERFAPNGRQYAELVLTGSGSFLSTQIRMLVGAVRALRADYEKDRLQTFREMVAADLFSDFLEQAEYLLDEKYKDAAAVVAGSVLEGHLKKLCDKNTVPTTYKDAKGNDVPKKLDGLNAALAKVPVYGKNDQKQVTAWAGIRNNAAHGDYTKYTAAQVKLMIQGIREFIARNPA